MGLKIDYPEGATPLDPDDAEGLIPTHITTKGQLNEWEYSNVARGEEWALATREKNILSMRFIQGLHKRMFGDTWRWAGTIRRKETLPVGVAPENIRPELKTLLENVQAQIEDGSWSMEEIAARFHHKMVYVHPFPNGNGRFARTIADLVLSQNGRERFAWGADLSRNGDARRIYIAALRSADQKDHGPLFALLGVRRAGRQ
jgi:Fic-DOC domain mobile mystery protein B